MGHLRKGASGHLLKVQSGDHAGKLAKCSAGCPCSAWSDLYNGIITACSGLTRFYYISGYDMYDDTLFSPCTGCSDCSSFCPPWDGILYPGGSPCSWSREPDTYMPEGGANVRAINGKDFSGAYLSGLPGGWTLTLYCKTGQLIWSGTYSGSTPAGTYTRTGGCDTRTEVDTLNVVGTEELEINYCQPSCFEDTYSVTVSGLCCIGPAGCCGGTVTRSSVNPRLWETTCGPYNMPLRLEYARTGSGTWDLTIWDTSSNLFGRFVPGYSMAWERCDPRGTYMTDANPSLCSGNWFYLNEAVVS